MCLSLANAAKTACSFVRRQTFRTLDKARPSVSPGSTQGGRQIRPGRWLPRTSRWALASIVAAIISSGSTRAGDAFPALVAPTNAATAGSGSYVTGLSANGRYVLFLSQAKNLVEQDNDSPTVDVFLRDRATATTKLISVATHQLGGGNGHSGSPSVSEDGRWVAFESEATDLAPGVRQKRTHIYLRDMASATTTLISVAREGGPGNGDSECPQISEDGRFIVFESVAGDLVPSQTNRFREVFRADRVDGRIERVSSGLVFPGNIVASNGPAQAFAMTRNAERIVYVRHLVDAAGKITGGEVFGYDARTSNTVWISADVVSRPQLGFPAACSSPAISGDGRYVVFLETNQVSVAAVYRQAFDVALGVPPTLITRSAVVRGAASVSQDGRFVAYAGTDGVHLWDGENGSNHLVLSNIFLREPIRTCSKPVLSAAGDRLAFYVSSNWVSTIHLYDRITQQLAPYLSSSGAAVAVNDTQALLVSHDGRTIAFDSEDSRLVEGDLNRASDVFVATGGTNSIECVSVRAPGVPSHTHAATSLRWPGSLSPNGRVIAISSFDFSGTDTIRHLDLQIRDRSAGQAHFLGSPTNGAGYPRLSADGRYLARLDMDPAVLYGTYYRRELPAAVRWRDLQTGDDRMVHRSSFADTAVTTLDLSPDGRWVAFVDRGSLTPSSSVNVYLWDSRNGQITLVSEQHSAFGAPAAGGMGNSTAPRFSPDGRWLFFFSSAWNLTTEFMPWTDALYARNLDQGVTRVLASSPILNYELAISADSRRVAAVHAPYGGRPALAIFDLETGGSIDVPSALDGRRPSLSADGRYLAYDDGTFAPGWRSIVVADTVGGSTELVTGRFGSPTDAVPGPHHSPAITPDARYVVFASLSPHLVTGDSNRVSDIFIRDRRRGVTQLLSLNRHGTGSGNGPSILPVLAADGRTVLFQSAASDLIEGDANETLDVFTVELRGPDTDGDQLDDDWEMAYFNTLSRDGSGDFDGDTASDRAEYELATDPTNRGSVFQVMTLARLGADRTRVLWSATPGRSYRVQYRDDLTAGDWTEASETVTAAGTTATWLDVSAPAAEHRFYRVVAAP